MSDRNVLGLELQRHFQLVADESVPETLVEDVLVRTALTRPRPSWRAGWSDRLPRLPFDLPATSAAVRLAVIALLLLVLLAAGLLATGRLGPGGTPFTGRWTSVDTDGSQQVLVVGAGLEPQVTFVDERATVCLDARDSSVRYRGIGGGLVQGDMLSARYPDAGCASYREHNVVVQYVYRSTTDTLVDTFDVPWHRAP